ncbi:ABC transporter ATP-binding protein [Tissierella praeacuta]|uniref:ABC transporter ATP-binding protein n=1 Tax=Tissierella praeacuta TaxID=43131 RepID=UPI0028B05099|nr:ABC transporter ATP-binding protein [Tissierella praeacuta]
MSGIHIENLSFSYENRKILENINLNIDLGEFVCILGPSGCGKSTLLRLVSGLETPTEGNIYLNEKKIKKAGLDRGIVFQDYSLFPWMSTGQNVELALEQAFKTKRKKDIKEISYRYLSKVGLEDEYNTLPKDLSGGMKQRVAIARAFAIDSPILLMDEPFGALDIITRRKLQELILKLWENSVKKTVLFVTHDIDEALLLSKKIIVMGKKCQGIEKIIRVKKSYEDDEFKESRVEHLMLKEELAALLNL